MVLVTGNWRIWLAGMAASLVIFAVVFFAVISPIRTPPIRRSSRVCSRRSRRSTRPRSRSGASAVRRAAEAQQTLNNAQKLTACVSAAGTDVAKVQACQVKFAK